MPKNFEDCVKNGGRVKTKQLKNNRYIRICYDKKGNSYAGEVMTTKKKARKKEKSSTTNRIEGSKRLLKSLGDLQSYFNENYHE